MTPMLVLSSNNLKSKYSILLFLNSTKIIDNNLATEIDVL